MLFFRLPIFIRFHDVEIPWSAYNICKPVLNFYLQLLAFFSFLIFLKSLVQTSNGATFTINIFFCVIKVSTLSCALEPFLTICIYNWVQKLQHIPRYMYLCSMHTYCTFVFSNFSSRFLKPNQFQQFEFEFLRCI